MPTDFYFHSALGVAALLALLIIIGITRHQQTVRRLDELENENEHSHKATREAVDNFRRDVLDLFRQGRSEQREYSLQFEESILKRIGDYARFQKDQNDSSAAQMKTISETIGKELTELKTTVGEKLDTALEKRLTQSFARVSQQLDLVSKGLGEMQSLALSVGDLKNTLTNVKSRGVWGEKQLGAILSEMFAPGQFGENVAVVPNSNERVEFALKLPGANAVDGPVWLPLDAKFPLEDYQRLINAIDEGDQPMINESIKKLDRRIREEAKKIRTKYIAPPHTTDFAILFFPSEGLYAEALRRPGLADTCQTEYRVILAGPTTLTALLNSLQVGFKTLAIQKRAHEVWDLLTIVRGEFGKFKAAIEATRKKLEEGLSSIDQIEIRNRVLDRKLSKLDAIPPIQENQE